MLLLARKSQNLPSALDMAEAVYRRSAAQLSSPSGERLAQRARYFAAGFRFGLEEPEAIRRLHGFTKDLHGASRLDSLLPRVLDGAVSLMGADFGNIQLLDPVGSSLWLATQSGFSSEFLNYFAIVNNGDSACGRAAASHAQAVIADVNADASFARHREIAAASGFCSVQSTPLTDYAGRLVGVISTHFRRPYLPPGRDLQIIELYSDFAGEAVARHLGMPPGDGVGDPVGRAMISALLGSGDDEEPIASAPPGLLGAPDSRGSESAGRPAWLQDAMPEFARRIVCRLFSVGLSLESARRSAGEGPAGQQVTAAANEADRMIHDIWELMSGLATEDAVAGDNDTAPATGAMDRETPAASPAGAVDLPDNEEACRRLVMEVAQLRRALRSRIVVEQAKGIVMAERRCGPEDAFKVLRDASNNSNVKLRDLAGELVAQAPQQPAELGSGQSAPADQIRGRWSRPLPARCGLSSPSHSLSTPTGRSVGGSR